MSVVLQRGFVDGVVGGITKGTVGGVVCSML